MAAVVLLGALAGAAVLVAAEFLTVYSVRVIHGSSTVPPVAAGTENHYALIPIALMGVALAVAAIRLGDRWALVAMALLGLIALFIGLLHDLPDAHRTGLVRSAHMAWVRGASSPGIGMYLETLGAVLLLLTAGLGLLLGEPVPVPETEAEREARRVPFGVEPPGQAAEVALARTGDGAPVADVADAAPAEVVTRPVTRSRSRSATPARPRSTTAKRSPAGKRSEAGGTAAKRTPATPKRTPATPRKRAPGAATASAETPAVAGTSPTAKRPSSSKRSPSSAAKGPKSPTAKRSPSPSSKQTSGPSSAKRAPAGSPKRAPSTSARRAPSTSARKPASPPTTGGPVSPRTRPKPKRSEP